LARAIAGPRPVTIDARLQEMDFGAWEGQLWSALPRADLDRWAADVAGFRPPGGECFHDVLARLRDALNILRAPHLIVTHAGVIRAAQHALGGMPLLDAAAWPVPYFTPITFRQPH
jgi:alpha-ribazole phosphatase